MANVLNEAARELPCLVVKPEMLRNKQENKTYQNEQSGDAECHAPQPATGSRGCLFRQRGWLFHRGLIYIHSRADSSRAAARRSASSFFPNPL
jgi:hypothetical protein